MSGPTERLDTRQVAVVVSNLILGAGILSLPRVAAEKTAHSPDAWLAVIGGGLLAIVAGIGMALLSRRYPNRTIYDYIPHILGKAGGRFYSLLVLLYFLGTSSFQVRSMAEVSGYFLLEGTPNWIVVVIFLWIGLYLMLGGIEPIARLCEFILPFTIIVLLILLILSIRIFELKHILPIGGSGIVSILHGFKSTSLAYSGAESILLLTAYMSNPSRATKAVVAGIAVPLVIYVVIVFLTIGALTAEGTIARTWPTIDLIRSFEIQGLVFERFESLLLVTWILQIFTSFVIAYYAAALGAASLLGTNLRSCLFGLLPLLFVLIRLPRNFEELSMYGEFVGNSALFLFGGLPWLFLLISIIKERVHAERGADA